ncbi:MAG: serine hydrolase domain-containing protein [Chryseosolibacter sp.]
MEARYASITALIFLLCCQPAQHANQTTIAQKLDDIFNTVPDFSGVALVAENGTPVYHKAFGHALFQTATPLDTTAVFELASVSKQFTAMIMMMLREEGKLDFDDPLEKYIPGLPYPGITIRHLLNHTSGLPDYQAVMDAHWDKSKVAGNEDNIRYLIEYHPHPNFKPGEKYDYSNTGYMLLASVAERVSGEDFIELCRERIFRPLNMRNTAIRTKEDKINLENMAWGHLFVPEKNAYIHADSFPAFNYSIWLGNRKGPGRVSSTASDLLKWDRALYNEAIIKNKNLREAFADARLNDGTTSAYGFGWSLGEHPRLGKKIFHTGDNPGYKTILIRYVDARKTLILLCNNAHKDFDRIVSEIENEIGG